MKLVYHLLHKVKHFLFKRKKPINKSGKPTVRNPYIDDKYAANLEKFDRNMRKEREIGVHPKYRNKQSQYDKAFVKNWEKLEKEWEEKNNV